MRDRKNDQIHRRIVEVKIGRALKTSEVVHHEDEDKTNNTPHNVSVKSRSAHTSEHNKHRSLSTLRRSLRMVKEERKLY